MTTSLDESARRAGAHHWAETRLFEVLGGWVGSTPEVGAKLMLDRHSHHHAWRAGQWWDRLPVLADVDRRALSAAPQGPAAAALDRLAGLEGTAARLAGAYRVALPRLWVAYERHLGAAGPVSDGSTRRTLAIVAADIAADWHEGEVALQGLLTDRDSVAAASRAVAAIETLLAAA
jgi:hypothetical protein